MNIKSNKIVLAVIAVLSFVFAYLYDKWKYISEYIESIKHSEDNLKDAIEDEYGVKYSRDGKKLFPASVGVVIPLTFDCSLPVFCQNSTLFALTFGRAELRLGARVPALRGDGERHDASVPALFI